MVERLSQGVVMIRLVLGLAGERDSERDATGVERAIAEIRSARPVVVEGPTGKALVVGVEDLDADKAARLGAVSGGQAHLVLSPARLRRLGLSREQTGTVALPEIDHHRIESLALKVEVRIDAPVGPASTLDEEALELARLALVLPAVIVIPIASGVEVEASILRVPGAAIRRYRQARVQQLRIVSRAPVPLEGAPASEFVVFRGGEGLRDQVAIIVGKPDLSKPVAVRLHSACLTGDLFGSLKCDCGDQLRETVRCMAQNEGGILLYLDQEGRGNGIANKIRAYKLQSQGYDTYDADEVLGFDLDQRRFDFAAAMLTRARRDERADHDQQSGKDRRPAQGRPRRGLRPARSRAADRRECPLSRLEARPRRPYHRFRRAGGLRSASKTEGGPRVPGRSTPMAGNLRALSRVLGGPVSALALRRSHHPVGRRRRISIRSCSSWRSRSTEANGPSGRPIYFPARRRSPIRNR